ncbi:unnamed protein product [Ambrosiozyma monospora]|uniref:Unnamed protein product n=1 Tax=Ambrosiozyma monospora TaxID=43982 RepID=A0ACB5T0L4_AMBMO|nr:unnamed protein product [Ambrosiozyma monospora]
MNDRVPGEDVTGYPFCIANGTELVVGETYWITWDPTYWGGNDITQVQLQTIVYPPEDNDEALFTSEYVNNNNGYYAWTIKSSYKKNEGYFWLNITPLVTSTSDAEHTGTKSGPLLRIVDNVNAGTKAITRVPSDNGVNDNSSSSSSGSNDNVKKIVPAVVVPVVVVGALLCGILFYFKKMRKQGDGSRGFFSTIRLGGDRSANEEGVNTRTTRAERIAAATDAASVNTDDLRSEYSRQNGNVSKDDLHTIQTATTGNSANPFK